MPSGQRNRDRGRDRWAGEVHCRGVRSFFCCSFFFASEQEPGCRFRLEIQFHFLMQFLQSHFKVSKMREGPRSAVCRREMSSEELIRCDPRRVKKDSSFWNQRFWSNPGLNFSESEWNRVTVKSCSDLITFIVGDNC